MYICKDCGKEFIEPKEISAEKFYGVSNLFDYPCGEKIKVCPHCNSNDLKEKDEKED